jgi:hypothetical protein
MSLVGFQRFQDFDGGSSCPTITLYDLDWNTQPEYMVVGIDRLVKIGANFSESATGGTAPYTLSVTSGSLPTGTALAYNPAKNVWGISGITTTFGSYTFTIGGTDANGCPITPKVYTLYIGKLFGGTTGAIGPSTIDSYTFTVSGIAGVYGTNAKIGYLNLNSVTFSDLTELGVFVDGPGGGSSDYLLAQGFGGMGFSMDGANLASCQIMNNTLGTYATPALGGAPYTGQWSDITPEYPAGYFSYFTGQTMNGTWTVNFDTGPVAGTLGSMFLLILPI